MNRRDFLRTAGGAAGATAAATASGSALAQEGGGQIAYEGWFDGVGNFDGTTDLRGEDSVTVEVGAQGNGGSFAFSPPAIWVDPGTTVTWEWTGEGGNHNVVADDGTFDSGTAVSEAGTTFEYTFDEGGVFKYICEPHEPLGMKGAVAVGDDVPMAGGGGGVEQDPEEMGVPFQPHFVGIATALSIGASLIFTFFLLKYGESPHTSGGR